MGCFSQGLSSESRALQLGAQQTLIFLGAVCAKAPVGTDAVEDGCVYGEVTPGSLGFDM